MHLTSRLKFDAIANVYLRPRKAGRILDVGSRSYEDHRTYRDSVPGGWEYVGLDLEPGPGVDLVPAHPYLWRELATGSFDACVTGQTFEHNPLFWVTAAEMARVTKPGGVIVVIAPGRGPVHRYPFDCWRFYPDAWASLAAYTGLELIESHYEAESFRLVEAGASWGDSTGVFRRPVLKSAAEAAFQTRLRMIAATAESVPDLPTTAVSGADGALAAYERTITHGWGHVLYRRARRLANLKRTIRKLFIES